MKIKLSLAIIILITCKYSIANELPMNTKSKENNYSDKRIKYSISYSQIGILNSIFYNLYLSNRISDNNEMLTADIFNESKVHLASNNNILIEEKVYSAEDLSIDHKSLLNKIIVFEGTVDILCCKNREIPLISTATYVNKKGNATSINLEFKDTELNIVRNYKTDMRVKVRGKIRKVTKEPLAYSDYIGTLYETKIYISNCKIIE
jgi:hypothetical protein